MKILRNRCIKHVLNTKCERSHAKGGPALFRALLKQGPANQLNLMIALHHFGGANAPMLAGLSQGFSPASVHCSLIHMRVVSDECF
jgi:riboflavin biosynthesis pyrimidine reductase